MKSISLISAAILSAAALFSLNSCSEKEPEPEPVIRLESGSVEVPEEGGTYQVKYRIENPAEGTGLKATCDADWVSGLQCDDTSISFQVAANEGEARQVDVALDYGNATASLQILQAEMTPVATGPFEISAKDITETSALYTILPEDKKMKYITFALSAKEIEEKGLQDDEALWQSDLEYLKADAAEYGETLEETVEVHAYVGDLVDMRIDGLIPGEEVVIYAYGISASGNEATRLTDIARFSLTPLSVEMKEVSFDISYASIPGEENKIKVSVTPKDGYSGWYFFDLLNDIDSVEAGIAAAMSNWYFNLAVMESWGYEREEILTGMCSQGPDSHEYVLEVGQSYAIFAAALNDQALICSQVSCILIAER